MIGGDVLLEIPRNHLEGKNFGDAGIEDIDLTLAQRFHLWKVPKYPFTVLGALSKSKNDSNPETSSNFMIFIILKVWK